MVGLGGVAARLVELGDSGNLEEVARVVEGVEGEGGLGYRLKRSLTVSHILDNFHRSFRVKRSQSQREVRPKKNKTRYGGRRLEAESHLVAGTQEDECGDVCLCSMVGVCV